MATYSFISGNTITIRMSVRDSDQILVNLDGDAGTLVIYDKNYQVVSTQTDIQKISTGIYEFEYTTDDTIINPTKFYYEVSGKVDGEDIVKRGEFTLTFA